MRGGLHHADDLGAAIEAHELGERFRKGLPFGAHERRPGSNRRGLRGFGGGGPAGIPLEAQILAAVGTGTAIGIYPARAGAVDATEVGTWTDYSGEGNHLVQATAGAKPDLAAAAVGSAPGVNFDGGDHVKTSGNADFSGANAYTMIAALQDTSTTQVFWGIIGTIAGNSYVTGRVNGGSDQIGIQARNTDNTRADSASDAANDLSSAGVVSITWDSSLATDECEVRLNGSNITSTRAVNSNNATGALVDGPITLGALDAGTSNWTRAVGCCVIVKFPSGLVLADVAAVEALLTTALAAGSWE